MNTLLLIFASIIVGMCLGYIIAHSVIATEAERLGAFYVGSKTYIIKEIVDTKENK